MKLNNRKRRRGCEKDEQSQQEQQDAVVTRLDDITECFLEQTRRVLLVGEIDEMVAANICSQLQLLSTDSRPIYMYINSPGGCMASGYAIIDQMLGCGCPVYTIINGQGHSMAAIIAAFGDKSHRYATQNSSMMLHSVLFQGSYDSIERHVDMVKYLHADYRKKVKDLSKRMKISSNALEEAMCRTMWMSSKDAIKVGLVDAIWTPQMEQAVNTIASEDCDGC